MAHGSYLRMMVRAVTGAGTLDGSKRMQSCQCATHASDLSTH